MRGMTLIETVVYIALLSVLMTGVLLTSLDLLEGSARSSGNATIQEEGNFVERKLSWALTDASSVNVGGSGCAQTLTVTKSGYPASYKIIFRKSGSTLQLSEGGGAYAALTTANVSVSCMQFDSSVCGSLGGVTATTTVNSLAFTITKCLH